MMLARTSWDWKACTIKPGGRGAADGIGPAGSQCLLIHHASLQPYDAYAEIMRKDGISPKGGEALSSYHI
jgi:hypothetical protein